MKIHIIFFSLLFAGIQSMSAQHLKYFSNDTLDQIVRFGLCYQGDHYFFTHTGDYYHQPSHPLLIETEMVELHWTTFFKVIIFFFMHKSSSKVILKFRGAATTSSTRNFGNNFAWGLLEKNLCG